MIRSAPCFPTAHLKAHDFLSTEVVWHPTEFPWFNVTAQVRKNGDGGQEVFMVPSLGALKKLLGQQDDSFQIDAIDYVTPGFMNGSGQWKMERLIELSELFNDFGWSIPRCTVDGNRVYRGLHLVQTDEWTIERQVYSAR